MHLSILKSIRFSCLVLAYCGLACCGLASIGARIAQSADPSVPKRPNVLIAISDDQSFPHASAYGDRAIKTPGFDRVAQTGVLFRNAFTPAPGCSPMRAALLTGREIWQLREAGTHASYFPTDLPVFPQQLESAGYHVGMTGKGWAPGDAKGWPHNPAGKSFAKRKMDAPKGISSNDYAANFDDFLAARQPDQPFCFWFGAAEPHREFGRGLGIQQGIDPNAIEVPKFLPDVPEVRSDLADYLFEIQWFDSHLVRMLERLDRQGELENTLVIVTSDNGMSFPRAKANLYEYGIHMPLAIAWPARIQPGQQSNDLVSLIDVTKTIFAAAALTPQQSDQMPGNNLLPRYEKTAADSAGDSAGVAGAEDDGSRRQTPVSRSAVFSGRERHSSSRYRTLGYPCRCVRTKTHLYIRNFAPMRYPAGAPQVYQNPKYDASVDRVVGRMGPVDGGYHDIDGCPTLDWMVAHQGDASVAALLKLSVGIRPAEELFDIVADPDCLHNLAADPKHQSVRATLSKTLEAYLRKTGDIRVTAPEQADVWETYPRMSALRWFPEPEWARVHPDQVPEQTWLDERRPQ